MRTNKVIIVMGTRGTGKTDWLKNLIAKMVSVFSKRLVVDTFDSPVWHDMSTWNFPDRMKLIPVLNLKDLRRWKKGTARMFSSNTREIMEAIQQHSKNTFIVFEDATKYVGSRLTDDVRLFVLDSKQKNLDLVFVFHSLMAPPPELIRISDIAVLFKTGDPKVPSKWDGIPEIEKAFHELENEDSRYANRTIQLL